VLGLRDQGTIRCFRHRTESGAAALGLKETSSPPDGARFANFKKGIRFRDPKLGATPIIKA
jgi:hypothetical protein